MQFVGKSTGAQQQRGGGGGSAATFVCPSGVITGIYGRSGAEVDNIGFTCDGGPLISGTTMLIIFGFLLFIIIGAIIYVKMSAAPVMPYGYRGYPAYYRRM